ncbi:MAG: endodeoxyribonuclease [Morganella sp. (in: enterobacteria)]
MSDDNVYTQSLFRILKYGSHAGINPEKDFPLIGDAYNAPDDTFHQMSYATAIHQHLFKNV